MILRSCTTYMHFFGLGPEKLDRALKLVLDPDVRYSIRVDRYELILKLRIPQPEFDGVRRQIVKWLNGYFVGYEPSDSIELIVGRRLIERNLTVTGAESLTAGMFQSTLGNVPGISAVFPGGFVTYSDHAKHQLLSIPSRVINKYGVVSEPIAKWMAEQSRKIMGTDLSVSFTGAAGPASLEGHPAGTVWIGLAVKGRQPVAHLYHLGPLYRSLAKGSAAEIKHGSRDGIRLLSVKAGLKMVEDELNRTEPDKRR